LKWLRFIIIIEVPQEKNLDDEAVLKTLTSIFRHAKRDIELVSCYEHAIAMHPEREALHTELVRCYARVGDFKKMQAMSLKAFKSFNNSKYVFWTVCAILIQEDLSATSILLAERMLRKVLFETRLELPLKRMAGAEEVLLWVEVLNREASSLDSEEAALQKKIESLETLRQLSIEISVSRPRTFTADTAVDFRLDSEVQFHSDPSVIEMSHFRCLTEEARLLLHIISILSKKGDCVAITKREDLTREVIGIFEEMLSMNPDQWEVYALWIDLVVQRSEYSRSVDGIVVLEPIETVLSLRRKLCTLQCTFPSLRGPFLAEIHLLIELSRSRGFDNVKLREIWDSVPLPGDLESISLAFRIVDLRSEASFFTCEISKLLCRYIALFDCKQCCHSDIVGYLELVFLSDESSHTAQCCSQMQHWIRGRYDNVMIRVRAVLALPVLDSAGSSLEMTKDICRLAKLQQIVRTLASSFDILRDNSCAVNQFIIANVDLHIASLGMSSERMSQPGPPSSTAVTEDRSNRIGDELVFSSVFDMLNSVSGFATALETGRPRPPPEVSRRNKTNKLS
jgi:hypothetical protein